MSRHRERGLTSSVPISPVLRHRKGETQAAIAKRFRVSQAAISYWFREQRLGAAAVAQFRYLKHQTHMLRRQVGLLKKQRQAAVEIIYQFQPSKRRRSLLVPLIRAKHALSRPQANAVVGLRPTSGHTSQVADRKLIDFMWRYLAQHPYAGFETLFRVLRHKMPASRESALDLYEQAFSTALERRKVAPRPRLVRTRMPQQSAIDAMWSIDFMRGTLADGESFWITTGLDDFNREGLFAKVSKRRSARAAIACIREMLGSGRRPASIRSDNGTEFKSIAYKSFLLSKGIRRTHSRYFTSTDNAYIENFNKFIRYDVLERHECHSLKEAQQHVDEWLLYYNFVRPQKPLGGLSPAQFAYAERLKRRVPCLMDSEHWIV